MLSSIRKETLAFHQLILLPGTSEKLNYSLNSSDLRGRNDLSRQLEYHRTCGLSKERIAAKKLLTSCAQFSAQRKQSRSSGFGQSWAVSSYRYCGELTGVLVESV